ncbi:hypothetical protein QA601_02340 [Chitinispirillales bacterium ANBcel5]|uniref:hypothetical protein n=1 Tax=Cellulosispirillum alkaliphilum TaxID=3039283 RepID=UPI002A4F0FF0|nr:hypothetical protein [Chitinispirillales bacterium ANBcel5]
METIFDHNVNEHELLRLFGTGIDRKLYMCSQSDPDGHNGLLFHLYSIRRNQSVAKRYLKRIKDPNYVVDLIECNIVNGE